MSSGIGSDEPADSIQILGNDGVTVADVTLDGGKNKLETTASISGSIVDRGRDSKPDSYFTITAAGAISDTIRLQLVATIGDTTSPDRDIAAVDETYTLVAGDVGDELQLRDNLVTFHLQVLRSYNEQPKWHHYH